MSESSNPGLQIIEARFFQKKLMDWFAASHRPLPWKGEKDPYIIWLSEIILQQTRVEQGLPYFKRFVDRYPTVEDLAGASQDEVLKLWEGLGYYSRARNMHAAAQYIAHELNGKFPDTYESILQLKGVGPYTAAAIASFAYGLPHAVVDGNVFRVLARFFGIETPIDSTEGKKQFARLAENLLEEQHPGRYNQAIMDFGAILCSPKKPLCPTCPLKSKCQALQTKKVQQLPVKTKKIQRRTRFFHYLVINEKDQVLIKKREQKDIWRNLYDFPMIERTELYREPERILSVLQDENAPLPSSYRLGQISPPYQQLLTHQKIVAVFIEIHAEKGLLNDPVPLKKVERKNLTKFAFPKLIDCYLKDKSLYLNL